VGLIVGRLESTGTSFGGGEGSVHRRWREDSISFRRSAYRRFAFLLISYIEDVGQQWTALVERRARFHFVLVYRAQSRSLLKPAFDSWLMGGS
jgi:hypothetical protein